MYQSYKGKDKILNNPNYMEKKTKGRDLEFDIFKV
jgi:hypothetical protein